MNEMIVKKKNCSQKAERFLSVLVLLLTVFAVAGSVLPAQAAERYVLGDADNDGAVTPGDARLVLRETVKLNDNKIYRNNEVYVIVSDKKTLPYRVFVTLCDVDNNGAIEALDARAILRMTVGLDISGSGELIHTSVPLDEPDKEFYRISISGNSPFEQYSEADGRITGYSGEFRGTDHMPAPKYLLINFTDETSRIMLYFFNKINGEFIPRWDILDFTSKNGIKNLLSYNNTRNRVLCIPDNVYMQVCAAAGDGVELYGWNGRHIGCEMTGTCYMPADHKSLLRNDDISFSEDIFDRPYTGLTVPGDASLLWCRDASVLYLWGIKDDGSKDRLLYNTCRQVCSLPEGYAYFRAILSLEYEISGDTEGFAEKPTGTKGIDLNDKVSCLCDYTGNRPEGKAADVIGNAKAITGMEWTAMADKNQGKGYGYTAGTVYSGIPYSSEWIEPHYLGWHISRHTFMNAANDPDSIFYEGSARNTFSMGYGLVCSSFASLCCGWPYPVTTYCLLKDPQIYSVCSPSLVPGTLMFNNAGHCMIGDTSGSGNGWKEYTLYESVNPMALRRSEFSFIDNDTISNTRYYNYAAPYVYGCHHIKEPDSCSFRSIFSIRNYYDMLNYSITGGSARPYPGDRSVCTSKTGVLINIKNSDASKLIVNRYSYAGGKFGYIEKVTEVNINGRKRISLNTSLLEDGAFYGFCTDNDPTVEYIEYRVVPDHYVYRDTGETIIPPDVTFWYMQFWHTVTRSDGTEKIEPPVIPYLTPEDDVTYSDYRKVYDTHNEKGYIFFKGVLGAYCTDLLPG